jgi:ribosomal protein S18 acetylase RimI-like enzyme
MILVFNNKKQVIYMEKLKIRKYSPKDSKEIEAILTLNKQYFYPEAEGPEAMDRVATCAAAIAFVAEMNNVITGYIKGIYDGSRAMIHLLSVHPDYQHKGIGKALLKKAEDELIKRGAPSISVTVSNDSVKYWEKNGYKKLPVFLMLKDIKQ